MVMGGAARATRSGSGADRMGGAARATRSGSGADRMGGEARATRSGSGADRGAAAEPTGWEAQRERPMIMGGAARATNNDRDRAARRVPAWMRLRLERALDAAALDVPPEGALSTWIWSVTVAGAVGVGF